MLWLRRYSVWAAILVAAPAFAGFPSTETFLPAVGRVTGQGGAQFYTTVWATNLTSVPVSFTFDILKQGQDNSSPVSFTDNLAAGETKVYENIVENKFSLTSAIGAARVTSTGEILVAERIYDQPPGADVGNTVGLFFAGVPKSFSISAGQSASIQGIDQGGAENFRYNFALVETGGGSPTVNVQLFDGNGTMLGQKAYVLQPYEQIQPNVADIFPGVATTNSRLTATVTGGSGSALIAGAQLANESQDSSGFEMSFRDQLLGGGAAGVSSLNALTGAVSLIAGTNVTLTTVGNGIKISAAGGSGGGAGVSSLNALTGALTIAHGANTTVNVSGSTITIDAVSGSGTGLTAVAHDNTLVGSGTAGIPLAVAPNLVLTSAVNDVITGNSTANTGLVFGVFGQSTSPSGGGVHGTNATEHSDGYLGGNDYGVFGTVTQGGGFGVIGQNSATGNSGYIGGPLEAVHGETNGSSYLGVHGISGNGTGVKGETTSADLHDAGVVAEGPHIAVLALEGDPSFTPFPAAVFADATGTAVGVYGNSPGAEGMLGISGSSYGVHGISNSSIGVYGSTSSGGVAGTRGDSALGSGWGVEGFNHTTNGHGYLGGFEYGVLGVAPTQGGASHFYAGDFQGDVAINGHLIVNGLQEFSFPHATDAAKEIHLSSPQGPEAGTYFRGSGRIVNGFATIGVPESFRMVTSDKGLTVQVTPMGAPAVLYCVKKDLQTVVIQGNSDVEFDYTVNGVRKGSESFSPVTQNENFVPRSADDEGFTLHLDAAAIAALKATGILNPDGSINLETAHRLRWDQRENWKAAEELANRR
jgi:hypothetical protein